MHYVITYCQVMTYKNTKPKHTLIADKFRSYILKGKWPVNSIMPSELELCDQFSASRTTIRKALETLSLDGLIERRKKKGTWVKEFKNRPVIWQLKNEIISFSYPEKMTGEIINTETILQDETKPFFKEFGSSESISRIKLLRKFDGVPFAFGHTYIRAEFVDAVRDNFEPETNNFIYQILEQHTGRVVVEVQDTFDAVLAIGEVAQMLEVSPGTPIFYIYRTLYGEDGTLLQATELYARPDIQKLKIIHIKEKIDPNPTKGSK